MIKKYRYRLLYLTVATISTASFSRWLFAEDYRREGPAQLEHTADAASPSPRLPIFLLIGVQKSGTTYIAKSLLRRRDDVCGPQSRDPYHFEKEAHFMDRSDQMAQGAAAYARLFQHCPKHARVLMDATPAYQLYPENVRSIYEELGGMATLQNLKILITLREPVHRDIAWYDYLVHHAADQYPPVLAHTVIKKSETKSNNQSNIQTNITFKTFDEYAQDYLYPNLDILKSSNASKLQKPHRGLYAYWLQRWVDVGFRRDQIWVVSYDDEVVKNKPDPRVFLNRLYRFLDLSTTKRYKPPRLPDAFDASAVACPIQEKLARAYQIPNQELYNWLNAHPGPEVERRPFPKFRWTCNAHDSAEKH